MRPPTVQGEKRFYIYIYIYTHTHTHTHTHIDITNSVQIVFESIIIFKGDITGSLHLTMMLMMMMMMMMMMMILI